MRARLKLRALSGGLTLVVLLVFVGAAQAAFPGENGRIAFTRYDSNTGLYDIHTVEPNGMAEFRVTSDGVSGTPAWSPDGERLAFSSGGALYTSDGFGTGRTAVIASPPGASDPDWSPDGQQLVVSIPNCDPEFDCATDIYVVNVDGTGLTNLTSTVTDERNPAWSPDGTRIAFDSTRLGEQDVYVMDSDGTGIENVTAGRSDAASEPDWSPDASRIVYQGNWSVVTANPDGTAEDGVAGGSDPAWSPDGAQIVWVQGRHIYRGPAVAGSTSEVTGVIFGWIHDREPDWQPAAPPPPPAASGSGYARPKAAGPIRVPLVVSYIQCTDGWDNRQHGPPLAYPSCHPPSRYATSVTVGTPDANGHAAEGVGYVAFEPQPGDPSTPADEADVRLRVSQTDVRVAGPGQPDHVRPLVATIPLRVTDRWNAGGADGSATVIEFALRLPVPCAATPDSPIGGTCSADTTADALAPGLVPEGKRSIWELGRVDVYDDRVNTNSRVDDRLFLTQGVYIP